MDDQPNGGVMKLMSFGGLSDCDAQDGLDDSNVNGVYDGRENSDFSDIRVFTVFDAKETLFAPKKKKFPDRRYPDRHLFMYKPHVMELCLATAID